MSSFNVQKALWALEETGVGYERIEAGGSAGGLSESSYLAMNPNGYIPTIMDGDFCLWESHAIVRYVAEKYGRDGLYPSGIEARAIANQWIDWMQCNLHRSFMDMFWGAGVTPYTSTYVLAECCVFGKQSGGTLCCDPLLLHPQGFHIQRAHLIPKLRC